MTVPVAGSLRDGVTYSSPLQSSTNVDAGSPRKLTTPLPVSADFEDSRIAADTRLAHQYAASLLRDRPLRVEPESTLGRWLEALLFAADSPLLKRLAHAMGSSLKTFKVNPDNGVIEFEGRIRLTIDSPELADIPGVKDIVASLLDAAKALAHYDIIYLPSDFPRDELGGFIVSSSAVQRFYGEPDFISQEQKTARANELSNRPIFSGYGALPDDETRLKNLRMTGEAHVLNTMLSALKKQGEMPDATFDLETIEVAVAPHSALWSAQQKQPVTLSLKQLIVSYGLRVPATKDELANLERALSAPPLSAPVEEDYGGLLSKEVPLGEADQQKVREVVNGWKTLQTEVPTDGQGRAPSLLEYLQRALPASVRALAGGHSGVFLKALISTPQARALGNRLQEAIGALPTQTSAQEVLLAALVVDADPNAGQRRNNLAGYNLRQQSNWGHSPAEIRQRFEKHLEARFGPQLAKVVAYQLLAMSAPEFLVQDPPPSMVYGSQQWASFSTAVIRRELDTPGASAGQAYADIMQRDALEPISEEGQSQLQAAAIRSVIDWGIANCVIDESSDDAYSAETIDRAASALQQQVDRLVEAAKAVDVSIMTRRELTLIELMRVYGPEKEGFFEDKTLLGDLPPSSRKRGTYSLLDIYMSGDLYKHDWTSSNTDFTTATVQAGFSKLPPIKDVFDAQFNAYADGLKRSLETSFQYQLSLLPVEDRLMIERGKVTTFCLNSPSSHQGPVRSDHPMLGYLHGDAILIRAELNGKTGHYLYSPSKGKIIRDVDPSGPGLPFPGSRLYFSMERPGRPDEHEDTVTILWQALGTPWPETDKIDFAALSIYPSKSLEMPAKEPYPKLEATAASARVKALSMVVSAYFSQGLDAAKKSAFGETTQERDIRRDKASMEFLRSFILFYETFKSFKNGRPIEGLFYLLLDVVGLVLPALKGGVLGVKAGAKGLGATLGFLKGFVKAGAKAANPLRGIYDTGRGLFNLAKLSKRGFKSLSGKAPSLFDKLRHAHRRSGSFDIPHAGKKDAIAEGVYRPLGANTEAVPAVAVQRNGKWYAYDAKTMQPYGAPLKGFTPSAASVFIEQAVELAVGAVINQGTDFGVGLAFQLIQPQRLAAHRFQIPYALAQAESAQQDSADSVGRIVDQTQVARAQTLQREFQRAKEELAQLTGEEVQGGDIAPEDAATDIIACLEQMEIELVSFEELVAEKAEEFRVFFKRYHPAPTDLLDKDAIFYRLNSIEKRLAAVKETLCDMTARRDKAV